MSQREPSSVRIFAGIAAGHGDVNDEFFYRYISRLSHFARARLAPRLRRRIDPEDVVMSAYRSFFAGAKAGRFSIDGSGELWALLVTIVLRKIYRSAAHHSARKRNVDAEVYDDSDFSLAQWVEDNEPTPAEAVAVSDELEAVLGDLPCGDRRVLELRLQGDRLSEIASETNQSERNVRRILNRIQEHLRKKYGVTAQDVTRSKTDGTASRMKIRHSLEVNQVYEAEISFDQLLLQRLIGRGGMGKVYEGLHLPTDNPVAVKFLHKSFQQSHMLVQRFLNEARVVSRLIHPGIVRMHGVGCTKAGVYFIVMDLVSGTSLAEIPLPVSAKQSVAWIEAVANAVSCAHDAGVVHCDLKPGNVLITKQGDPILVDFGLAQRPDSMPEDLPSIGGTAPWMAPEQVDSAFGPVTGQTDVYGLGALLYTLLTGSPPYPGRRVADILSRLLSAESPCFPVTMTIECPPVLKQLCLSCLAKAASDRPSSAAVVVSELTRIAAVI